MLDFSYKPEEAEVMDETEELQMEPEEEAVYTTE